MDATGKNRPQRRHKNLTVWQDAVSLVTQVYRLTARFPDEEKFGLASQVRRSAVSVASNIAEGAARDSDKDFLRFLYIARGSLAELETQLQIANNLHFIEPGNYLNDIERIFAKLASLISKLKAA